MTSVAYMHSDFQASVDYTAGPCPQDLTDVLVWGDMRMEVVKIYCMKFSKNQSIRY